MTPESPVPTPGGTGAERPLMDETLGWRTLLLNLLLIPAGLLLLLPLAILVALWFYLVACKEGVRLAFGALRRRRGDAGETRVLPAPHFKPQGSQTRPGA